MNRAAVPELIFEARAALEEHGEAIAPLFTMPGELDAHRRALGRSDADLADRVVLAIARRSAEHILDAARRAKRLLVESDKSSGPGPVRLVRRFPISMPLPPRRGGPPEAA